MIKYLEYKSNGNEIKWSKDSVKQIGDLNLYMCDKLDSNSMNDYHPLLTCVGGVYYNVGRGNSYLIQENMVMLTKKYGDEEKSLETLKKSLPNLLHIEVLRLIGENEEADKMVVKREELIQHSNDKQRKLNEEYNRIQEETKQKHIDKCVKTKEDILKLNVFVYSDDLLDCMKHFGYKLPIQTIGSFRKQDNMQINKTVVKGYKKGTQSKTLNSYFQHLEKFIEFLVENK